MLINSVMYAFPDDKTGVAERLLAELRDASRKEAGCRGFYVSRSITDPRVFVLYELWDDQAALDAHYATSHFQRLGVEGIRTIAESRVGHLCAPLDA